MDDYLSCDKINLQISAYFDDELSENEKETVTTHLDKCPSCAQKLEDIKKLSGLIKNYGEGIDYKRINLADNIIKRVFKESQVTCNEVLEELSAYFDGEVDLKLHYLMNIWKTVLTAVLNLKSLKNSAVISGQFLIQMKIYLFGQLWKQSLII